MEGFPGDSEGKESTYSAGNPGSIPGLGRFPGEGNGNPLQYSCLKNSEDRRAWPAIDTHRHNVSGFNMAFLLLNNVNEFKLIFNY